MVTTEDVSQEAETEVEDAEDAAAKAAAVSEACRMALQRRQVLIAADKLYLAGDYAGAKALYQQVKPPFSGNTLSDEFADRPEPIYDPELLAPAGQVYWREGNAGIEQKLETRIFIPLELLVEKYPEFIPGHLLLAQALQDYDKLPQAVEVLNRATTLYPQQTDLLRSQIDVLVKSRQWLEASIAARQFALLNPDHPEAKEFAILAEENYDKFRSYLKKMITGNAIANVITGAATVALTGNPLGALSAVETLMLLAQGESGLGDRIANNAIENLEMVEDEEIVAYINELGQKLAKVSGRDDFEYEFHVVLDPNLNAFALPGGKVFVNAGAIYHTESEAELAGLLTHELAHAILSHGFQMVTHGNLVESMTRFVPFGGTIGNLLVLDYSRDMEQQADLLGTRMLAAADYAADGLRNLMVTLNEQYDDNSPVLKALSSHPPTKERIAYLESLITRGGYNRYAYEGVERHQQIRQRVAKLLKEKKTDDEDILEIE
ncbi:M48 family metalloprotease [Planktothricoides sp. FACHB-1370]|nr:M48 family metalloprotease [Planktothricoides raciborskii FACHB-1370]MBD2582088.1 M48 family metalloprotease [Planktothricoides raciborskii FACHB-1261]